MSLESKRMHLEISGCLIMRMMKMKVNLVNMKYQVKTGSHTLTYYVIVNLIKKNILQSLDSLAQNKRSTIREQVTDLLPNHVIEQKGISWASFPGRCLASWWYSLFFNIHLNMIWHLCHVIVASIYLLMYCMFLCY